MKQVRRIFMGALLSAFLLAGCGEIPEAPSAEASVDSEAALQQAYDDGYRDGYESAEKETQTSPKEAVALPEGFVLVSDAVPYAILEIRYYSTYNFVGARIEGYDAPVAILTQEAADALRAVSDELVEKSYRLKIYDAYRPQCAVDHFKRWAEDLDDRTMKDYFYPDVEKEELFRRGYIASRSGHSRGSTVDLTLFDMRTGKDVDMGGTFDFFGPQSHADYTETLTAEQISNRQLLRDAMLAHGFRGIKTEWWHYTLVNEPYPEQYFDFHVDD